MEVYWIISIASTSLVIILLIVIVILVRKYNKLKSNIFNFCPIEKKPKKIKDEHFNERITTIHNKIS